jgi:hypothetical protein
MEETTTTPTSCKPSCCCQKASGLFVVLIGVAGLLRAFDVLTTKAAVITCSILAILAGLMTMMRGVCKKCSTN